MVLSTLRDIHAESKRAVESVDMPKLYVVRHLIEAESVKHAVRLSRTRQPDEVFIADEWFTKVGFIKQGDGMKEVKGFNTK